MIELRTLKEWNSLGYRVLKGSKATRFSKETKEALFDQTQVKEDPYVTAMKEDGIYFGFNGNPDEDDYDMGLCGQD